MLKRKNIIASIAQILLAVILLPSICVILHAVIPESGSIIFSNLLGELPVWGNVISIIGQLAIKLQSNEAVNLLEFFYVLIGGIESEILEATVMGLCIYACKSIGTLLYIRGVAVMQTLVGILLGTITIKSIAGDGFIMYMSFLFLFVLNVVLTIFETSGQWNKKIWGIFLGMGLQSIIAGFAAGYVVVMVYFLTGGIGNLKAVIGLMGITMMPLIGLLCLDYILFTPKKA
ncbi:MAG: hypothetical protein NC548_38620 [Lachnospiraceae bacterium]|nr:hypothetical protein [Lachnospiraceae bacterium]